MAATKRKPARRKSTGPKVDPYELVTKQIVEALEAGVVPWHRPWSTRSTGPMSLSTRKPYTGVNVFILGATAMVKGYESRWWGTYKQIGERGGQVRKGEKSTSIVFWRFFERKDQAGNVLESIPVLRYYSVFNADQCDDLTAPTEEPLQDFEPIKECDRISDSYRVAGGPKLKHGGNVAGYSPKHDYVLMPQRGQFESVDHYYGALFHEYAHSTGHESRLNRKGIVDHSINFGDEDYSREELVAEMTSAFVCGDAGIDVNVPYRASYIASWIAALKGDPKLVVTAGGAAQKAANLILGRAPAAEAQTTESEDVDANL